MRKNKGFPVGKLDSAFLEKLISQIPIPDRRVLVGPRIGEDAAVIEFRGRYLIAKTDPVTFAFDKIGWYAVTVNANDIAVMGGLPKWFLATVLLPDGKSNKKLVASIFDDIISACDDLGITLCGGHTEITYNLDRPIIVGQMLGEVKKDRLVLKSKIRIGDKILLTKGIAIEGTAIIAREREGSLKRKFGAQFLIRAKDLLFNPGISVLRDAIIAHESGDIHFMHDPTEGGLLSGLYELAKIGNVGVFIHGDKIEVLDETRTLCEGLRLDPMGLIASGALLIALSPKSIAKVTSALTKAGISCSVIGEVVEKRMGLTIERGGRVRKLKPPTVDEITKIFSAI